ncbi:hypothetical protein GCW_03970 [Mycoplasmoides gallisepticum S6]|uniref:Uncharacterized protein n=1 Tax=Mycoplasmoides gallisepticum S6 TaxID=1006581 RepID=A0A0F6CLR3_MYCGL|nr:hypothetical protein GCW_03970 [Mycoplasmoides gallisepticum S6]
MILKFKKQKIHFRTFYYIENILIWLILLLKQHFDQEKKSNLKLFLIH